MIIIKNFEKLNTKLVNKYTWAKAEAFEGIERVMYYINMMKLEQCGFNINLFNDDEDLPWISSQLYQSVMLLEKSTDKEAQKIIRNVFKDGMDEETKENMDTINSFVRLMHKPSIWKLINHIDKHDYQYHININNVITILKFDQWGFDLNLIMDPELVEISYDPIDIAMYLFLPNHPKSLDLYEEDTDEEE